MTAAASTEPLTTDQTPRASLVLALACGATFLTFLDTTVVNIAFPAIARSMPSEPFAHLSWIVISYTTLFAALLTTAGRYADVLGHRRIFMAAVALFTASSAACAVAVNLNMLVAARAVQGIGAAALIPSALGMLLLGTPAPRRSAAIGYWGAAGAVAAVVGPAIGGCLTEWVSWRMVFAINVPLGLVMLYGTAFRLPSTPWPRTGPLPDVLGGLLFTLGIGAVVVGLSQSGEWGATSVGVIVAVVGGLILTGLGVLRSRRGQAPAINLALLRIRTFAAANSAVALFSAAMYVVLLSSPLFLTEMWHYTLLEAALSVTPGAFTSAVVSIYLGRRAHPGTQRTAATLGSLCLVATAVVMYMTLNDHRSFWLWLPLSLSGGLAAGLVFTSLSVASSRSVPPLQFAAGFGLLTMARQVGGSLGIAIMAAMLSGSRAGHPDRIRDVFIISAVTGFLAIGPALLLHRPTTAKAEVRA
jgi:EmrB/QacA subfamily drug resistance transporter